VPGSSGEPGDAVLFKIVVPSPKAVCDTCPDDVDLTLRQYYTATINRA
jgi:hypothetical protein